MNKSVTESVLKVSWKELKSKCASYDISVVISTVATSEQKFVVLRYWRLKLIGGVLKFFLLNRSRYKLFDLLMYTYSKYTIRTVTIYELSYHVM